MAVSISEACALLESGHPVALPTETVYGLAAPLHHLDAIEKVFLLKGRPRNNPLIVHLSSKEQLEDYVVSLSPSAKELAEAFWPGPLTLVLETNDNVPDVVRCGLPTAAFRVPNHPMTQEIIRHVGPLVMPSANLSGRPSATRADHIQTDFGASFPVVDGGPCLQGLESTILMEKDGQWVILREGAVSAETIGFVLGYPPHFAVNDDPKKPLCPGQMYRHYAPQAKLHICRRSIPVEASVVVGFSDRSYGAGRLYALGSSDNAEEVAKSLYACLRKLDTDGVAEAWVDGDFPAFGLWAAVRNRLEKAAMS